MSDFPGQHEDEEVLMVFHQHPLVMRKPLIYGLLAILIAVLPLDFIYQGAIYPYLVKFALIVPILVLFYWAWHYVGWYYSIYIVTDQRILEVKQKGLFDRKVSEWQLNIITNVNYHVNGLQAVIFGYGNISVQTYTGEFTMPTIHKPVQIHGQLAQIVHRLGGASTPPGVSGSMGT